MPHRPACANGGQLSVDQRCPVSRLLFQVSVLALVLTAAGSYLLDGGTAADAEPAPRTTLTATAPIARTLPLVADNAPVRPILIAEGTSQGDRPQASTPPGAHPLSSVPIAHVAEALQLRFQSYGEISGIYRLNEDDTISIPGIGRINLGEMSAADLEATLSKRLLALIGRDSPVAVEIERYRHVFITGDVEQPGSFNWFRGMTVLKTVSLSGGMFRSTSDPRRDGNGVVAEQTLNKLGRAIARQARLNAELAGKTKIEMPTRLSALVGNGRAREFIGGEEALLGSRSGSRAASLRAIEASYQATVAEIARLKELQVALDTRFKSNEAIVGQLKEAFTRKIISNQRLLDAESAIGELAEKRASTRVQLARAAATEQQLARERIEHDETHRARLNEELAEIAARIDEFQIELDAVRKPDAVAKSEEDRGFNYEIVRRIGEGEVRMGATELDALRPGDTLIVTRQTPIRSDEVAPREKRNSGQRSSARQITAPRRPG